MLISWNRQLHEDIECRVQVAYFDLNGVENPIHDNARLVHYLLSDFFSSEVPLREMVGEILVDTDIYRSLRFISSDGCNFIGTFLSNERCFRFTFESFPSLANCTFSAIAKHNANR